MASPDVGALAATATPNPESMNAAVFARAIPHHLIPSKIGDMEVTPKLLEDYKGHENFLKLRAMHSPECYRSFDVMRLCILERLGEATCEKVEEAYQPCDRDLRRRAVAARMSREEERRKRLAAEAKVMAAAPKG